MYLKELFELGLVGPTKHTAWASATLVVPKISPVMYKLTIGNQAVNCATGKIIWPMTHIEAVMSDWQGTSTFAAIDLCSG